MSSNTTSHPWIERTDYDAALDGSIRAYLLLDNFATDRLAGAIDGTVAETGPAERVVTDTEDKLTISGSSLLCAGPKAIPAWGDPAFALDQRIYRVPGRTLFFSVCSNDATPNAMIGFYVITASGPNIHHGVNYGVGGTTLGYRQSVAPNTISVGTIAQDTIYNFAIVMRSSGAFMFVKGGIYTQWTLMWVDTEVASYEYITASMINFNASLFNIQIVDLVEPWTDDYGIATDFKHGNVAAAATFSHTSNCVIEYTVATINTAGSLTLNFREQDATNYWQLAIASNGSLILNEVVGGVPTSRGTGAVGSIASGQRIVIVADGSTIRVTANNTLKITYTSAANFATETTGALSSLGTAGVVTDIISYPRHYSDGLYPTASRGRNVVATVDVADYGAHHDGEAGYAAFDNSAAFQAAIFSGNRIEISTAGTYLLDRRLIIPSNRTIIGTVGAVILKKRVAYSHMFSNFYASNYIGVRDNSITLDNLTLDVSNLNNIVDSASATLRGVLTFCQLDNLALADITIIDGDNFSFAIHLSDVNAADITDFSHTGLKDGPHISGGCKNITIDGFLIVAGDDTFAVLANDYPGIQSNAGDCDNIVIKNGTSNCGAAPGFLLRFITGSWLPWAIGNTYSIGHLCERNRLLYKKVDGGDDIATDPPTHLWGDMTGEDAITWRWVGNGINLNNNVRNIHLHNITILDGRDVRRQESADAFNNSEYLGTENTSILDEFHTSLSAAQFTNDTGLLGNLYFDE